MIYRSSILVWLLIVQVFLVASALGQTSQAVEPERGVVAQMIVRGDLDTNAMVDEIVHWLARRDAASEILVVLSLDGQRARPDLATRIAEAVRTSRVPVAVHLDGRGPVSAQFLLIGLASQNLTLSRGVRVAGGSAVRLENLPPPTATGWKGAQERLARSVLGGRDELLLDLFVKPLGDVYLHHAEGAWTVARTSQAEEDVRIVDRMDDDNWRVDLPHEALTGLDLASDADGLGQVLRANNVRAFKRERAEVRSGLAQALTQVEEIRKDVSAQILRLKAGVGQAKTLEPRFLDQALTRLRTQITQARDRLADARRIFDRYPELYRLSPPWVFESDPDQRGKDWAKAFKTLSTDIDELSTDLDVLENP